MNHGAIYNEIDDFCCDWLDNLIAAGHIAPGSVDRRSIADLTPTDVAGPGQRHFFAGIAGWSHALRLAGVPDDADIWTGSCPCQPFSSAGTRSGTRDPRHLWPTWFPLIEKCRPPVIFGEQVASRDGLDWLDPVFADLERCGYAVGACDLSAAGCGAPHARQRLLFVAYTCEGGRPLIGASWLHDHRKPGDDALGRGAAGSVADLARGGRREGDGTREGSAGQDRSRSADDRGASELGDALAERRARGEGSGRQAGDRTELASTTRDVVHAQGIGRDAGRPTLAQLSGQRGRPLEPGRQGATGRLGDPGLDRTWQHPGELPGDEGQHEEWSPDGDHAPIPPGATRGFWHPADWLSCIDGVARPVEPGTFPLASGLSGRVGRLRAYGNSIVPPREAIFIRAALDAIHELTR